MKILLVDDETSVLEVIGNFLLDCGYGIVSAGDGSEALRVLEKEGDVGLVLSDIRMPRMTGLEFLRAVRLRFPGTPVILITGHGDESVAVDALHEGATDYLKKPVKLGQLLECIERIEERNRLEEEVLESYRKLQRAGNGGDGPAPSELVNARLQTDVAGMSEDLQVLEEFWRALRSGLRLCDRGDRSGQEELRFILDEVPAVLSGLRGKVERFASVIGMESAESPEGASTGTGDSDPTRVSAAAES
jgi:CheY-like chemotaxis protein